MTPRAKGSRLLSERSPLPGLLAFIVTVVTLLLTYSVYAHTPLIQADLSTYLLPSQLRAEGLGVMYVDLFDIKPPLTYAFFLPWTSVFGIHLVQMWLLYAVLLAGVFLGFWYLLRRFLNPWFALVVFSSCAGTIVGLGMLEELFFTTEVLCLVLTLGALSLLIRFRTSMVAVFFAAALIASAGQVKEVFLLAPLALVPLLLRPREQRVRRLVVAALGVAAALALTLMTLLLWGSGSLSAYLEILRFKRERFPAPGIGGILSALQDYAHEVIRWLPLIGLFILAIVALALLQRSRWRFSAPTSAFWRTEHTSMAVLFLAMLAGFVWQGAPLVLHYALAVIFPLYLLLAALLGWETSRLSTAPSRVRVIALAILVIGLVPSLSSVEWVYGRSTTLHVSDIVTSARTLESEEDTAVFREIDRLTASNQCIQAAYGWSATANYLYSHREACSRFVVPPLALDPEYRKQFQDQLVQRPPAVIIADRALSDQTALTKAEGTPESTIFPFESVLKHCYAGVPGWPTLYVPRTSGSETTSGCIAQQVQQVSHAG